MREALHVEAAMAVETVRAALVETLATESRVVAAYLFGSLAAVPGFQTVAGSRARTHARRDSPERVMVADAEIG
jgi:hypothetical protein